MVNHINMDEREKVNNIIKNLKESSNSELAYALDFLNSDFEQTKVAIIKLTKHIDTVELIYNKALKELESRK